MSAVEFFTCPVCGGDLEETGRDQYRCLYCGKVHAKKSVDDTEDTLRRLFDEGKKEKTDAARRNLWDAMHAEYINSGECLGYAYVLKSYIPDDYFADFAVTANSANSDSALSSFLNGTSRGDMETYAPAVLDFMMKSLTPKTCAAVSVYIERAFSPTSEEFRKYSGLYNDVAGKVLSGVFDVDLPRGAFLAYSSKDIAAAVELCDYLEDNGITCFLSSRNLTHGRGAVENYERSLETAIDSCNTFVFVSSGNSRSAGCEARSRELVYIMKREQAAHANETYDYIPQETLKHRVEYLIEPYSGSSPYDAQVRSFFHDLDWATDMGDVARRIADNLSGMRAPGRKAAPAVKTQEPAVKPLEPAVKPLEPAVKPPEPVTAARTVSGMAMEDNFSMAERYYTGNGVVRDIKKALSIFSGHEKRVSADMQYDIGRRYYTGDGVNEDPGLAFKWWTLSAERGNMSSQRGLGDCYYFGRGVDRDAAKAVEWYEKAAEKGEHTAQYRLGCLLFKGDGVSENRTDAAKWWQKAADGEIVDAEYNMGVCCSKGIGVGRDPKKAAEWYKRAAGDGHMGATYCLGICYSEGFGVVTNEAAAAMCFAEAAKAGKVNAMHNLACCYADGRGLEKDDAKAVEWFRKAAKNGCVESQLSLGLCCLNGRGVRRDLSDAVIWFRKAAEQGCAEAQYYLGCCYRDGVGVDADEREAEEWLEKAAERGFGPDAGGTGATVIERP